jgi:membrane-bound lytic murein transglycosylase B
LAADGFPPERTIALFVRPETRFDPKPMKRKLEELYRLQFKSLRTREIQNGLIALGYTPGDPDGLAGDNTRRAIKAFQEVHGLPGNGAASDELLAAINAELAKPRELRKPAVKTMVTAETPRRTGKIHAGYLTPKQMAESEAFRAAYRTELAAMERRFGVPAEFVVGILRVETNFGTFLGSNQAFSILASMASCTDFDRISPHVADGRPLEAEEIEFFEAKAREKGDWAYEELKGLLHYARANGVSPSSIPGSIYGAIGICQFMPSNAVNLGADGDGDGVVNLFTMPDAIHSIGSYFKAHGWEGDMADLEKQRKVIYAYNRSEMYVNTVMAVAQRLRETKGASAAEANP